MSSANSCYASLGTVNAHIPGMVNGPVVVNPHNPNKPVEGWGVNVVPVFGSSGYDALTHGNTNTSCGGYYTITNAYGADCGQYMKRACGGVLRR